MDLSLTRKKVLNSNKIQRGGRAGACHKAKSSGSIKKRGA